MQNIEAGILSYAEINKSNTTADVGFVGASPRSAKVVRHFESQIKFHRELSQP